MENWRDLVSSYPDNPEPKDYAKAIHSAEIILSQDLAPFETEWLAQTLLFKPVRLFDTIVSKRASEDWLKTIGDSFKLLSKIVEKYWDVVENYSNDIIELCMLSFDAQTRKEAILCLLCVVKHPNIELNDQVVSRHVSALEDAKTCKAPLAQLVGTICRYHPERVQEHFSRIWRIYLKMLQPNTKTDQVVNSVLQGINGLFEYFGDDIAMDQLNSFYDMMSRECIKISKCLEVLLSILKHHARLFKERLAGDRALRQYLWQIATKSAMDALCNIYEVIFPQIQNTEAILNSEILPHIESDSVLIKHTALRIIIQARKTISGSIPSLSSGIDLEFQLRAKKLSYEEASTVSWCINSSVANSETMLLTALMFYDNLPASKKRDIVVNGILKASDDVRKAALILLLQLCLREQTHKYIDIWRVLLDNTSETHLSEALIIMEEALQHILEVLASCVEDKKKVYTDIRPILSVMSLLLSLQKTELNTSDWCLSFRPSLVHLAKLYGVEPVKMISEADEDEVIYVEQFEDDTVLSKLLSTLSTKQDVSHTETLTALQKIFTKSNADVKVLSKVLSKMEVIMQSENNNLDKRQLSMIMKQILRLKSKTDTASKDARIFQKDVTIFLGKYGHMVQNENFSEDIYVMNMKNKFILNVPNIVEGTTYKIDLQRILQLCLLSEEVEALHTLLAILSAYVCWRRENVLWVGAVRVAHALCRSTIPDCTALLLADISQTTQEFMKCIIEEPCPNVRRRLSNCLEVLLNHEPGSESTAQLLNAVAEQALFLISRDDATSVLPGLDITRAFISTLSDNNALTVTHLPIIIINILNAQDSSIDLFERTTNIFIEKIDLFSENTVKELLIKILKKQSTNDLNFDTLNNIMQFTKRVVEIKKYEAKFLISEVLEMFSKLTMLSPQFLNLVAILAYLNLTFEFESQVLLEVSVYKNGKILEQFMEIKMDDYNVDFKIDAMLIFLKEYGIQLNDVNAEKTLQCLGNIIENIPPSLVLKLKNNLTPCVSVFKNIVNIPSDILSHYEKWIKKLDLQNITEYIEEKTLFPEFSDNFSDVIHALKIMSDLFEVPTVQAKSWTILLVKNLKRSEIKWGRLFLSDLLAVSEKSLTDYEFEVIFEEKVDFLKSYINVYFRRLIKKPFILTQEKSCLLVEIVEYFAKTYKEEDCQNVLELVDNLWPSFEQSSTFDEKLSVLLNLFRLPKRERLDSLPVKWALSLLTNEGTSIEDRIKLIATLPKGEEYSTYYRKFASHLPVLLSEMQAQFVAPFRALLDTLAVNGDTTLLDIVLSLGAADDTKGWWDSAIEACMTSLAAKEDTDVLDRAFKRTRSSGSPGICNRILLPLLRHSSRKFLEKYMSSIVSDLLGGFRVGFREPSNTETYRKRIAAHASAFTILTVAFEKLSTESLESGIINEKAGSDKPWYFLEQTCKLCVTISANVRCPSDASEQMKETCLWLHCSSYNCLTNAICRRKLSKNLCARVFNIQTWSTIVDDKEYTFELQAYARYRGSKPAKRSVDGIATSSTFTGTVRSRLFLTTLSENPLQYDMIPDDDEEEEEDDSSIEYENSVLNAHGCLSTLTGLFEQASTLEHTDWRSAVISALTANVAINVKWLLAQAICNAVESLKPHASALCPALFQLIAETSNIYNGKHVLNNLHIDIISTIIKWEISDLSHNSHLDTTIEYLIYTCMEFKYKVNIHRRLLKVLNNILQMYGKIVKVSWNMFLDYCKDLPKDILPLLPIFERLLRNGVSLPDLLTAIFANTDAKFWVGSSKLAEITGLALSLADGVSRERFLAKFGPILHAVRSINVNAYIKMVFYAQKSCKQCCDFQHFKIITDLSTKVEKPKCLTIISTYLEDASEFDEFYNDMFQIISLTELFDSDLRVEAMRIARNSLKFMDGTMKDAIVKGVEQNCRSSAVQVRKEAFSVILKAFQDLVKREDSRPFKRKALDSSPILEIIDAQDSYNKVIMSKIFDGIFDTDQQVSRMMADGLEEFLSKDIPVRFAELFFIIVYQSSVSQLDTVNMSNCGAVLLNMLFSDMRQQDAFKDIKLRDEGLPQSVLQAFKSVSTKTYTTAIPKTSGVSYKQKVTKASEWREINVQIPITDILEVLLQLSKTNSQVCQELCVQIMKCLQGTGRRFDLDSVISKQLFEIMKRKPNCLTPLVIEACRIFINGVSSIQGFKESVQELKQAVFNSEGHLYTSILYEDLMLRSGDRNQFILRMVKEDTEAAMREQEFTLEGLINVFGILSNWEDLRIQDKKRIEDSLPPLWTKDEDFTMSLRNYFEGNNKKLDYSLWFNKMVASFYPEEIVQDRLSWLKQTEKWPRRDFVTSAIIEAIECHQCDGKVFSYITPSDCLAEWAAWLMIRSAYNSLNSDSESQGGRGGCCKEELFWCREANRRGLPDSALQCIERNKECLLDVEVLPWVQEKVIAYRTMGLRENSFSTLQKALENAEKQTIRFASQSPFETNICMQKLILQLHHDVGSISKPKLDDVMQEVTTYIIRQKARTLSTNNAQVLKSLYETAMMFYDEQWDDNDEILQNDLIMAMLNNIDKMLDHNLTKEYNLLLCILLNRLVHSETTISDVTAKYFLNQINRVFHHLDTFSVAILKKVIAVLPSNVLNENYMNKLQDTGLDVCKKYFQAICDPNYSLLQYCDSLRKSVLDDDEWNKTFEKMKSSFFETSFEGSDYQALNTLKNRLYALENMVEIDPKAAELKSIIDELVSKPQRSSLRLSQISPHLCSAAILETKRLDLQRILRLPTHLYVVKFAEQVTVFTDSIRRPCVLKALLSDGSSRRYIVKSGEPMMRDASVQRTAAILDEIVSAGRARSYNVTPLSEDSAIIEYLEDHVRLRDLMEEKHDINIAVTRVGYEKLILAPSLAMEQYNAMCDKVTPYILRSAIENICSCMQEFIEKKRTFEDTLSAMTILSWLFGVGDRHLQNIMFSARDGGVCGVDWASIFQYGCHELPPARLTANLLAVCDLIVLESRLQNMLLTLRDSQKLYEAYIRISFYWMGPESEKLKYVNHIIEGKTVSYQITRECIDESSKKYKQDYVRLLDKVFENFTPQESYTVEEQVSCLLQHCTEPRILAVTPPGWEAWL